METAPRLYHVANSPADRHSDADAFFDTLRKEQRQFLDGIGRARSLLANQSGELAKVTAMHGQLTRQFLDAQRSIMKRRADAEAEVALIVEEAAALCGVMIGGFDHDESACSAAQRQLSSMLDDWWLAENRNSRAMVDSARARATAQQHCGVIETEIVQPPWDPPSHPERVTDHVQRRSLLPSEMVSVLDAADPAELLSVLATLAEMFEPSPVGLRATEIATETTFREFWDKRSVDEHEGASPSRLAAPRHALRLIAAHIVLPMTVVTSAFVGLMVWIG